MSAPKFESGQILAGKYRFERVLGVGGMGMVLLAHHLELDELVAIKVVLPEVATQPSILERFSREARAAIRIKSEHVARVMDVGRLDDGLPFMVMEYLEGSDLGAMLESRTPLSISETADYVIQACEAVAYAHALGIVHRDLKPGNLFVTRRLDGTACIKVLDFGISKVSGRTTGASGGVTKTTAVMGSPMYMSPEQMVASRDVDSRTDIWSLGVILYELLSGVHPFEAELLPQICALVMQARPRAIREIRPDIPPALASVVAKCLEKERAERWNTVGDLAAALAPFASQASAPLVERMARTQLASLPPDVTNAGASVAMTVMTGSSDIPTTSRRRNLPILVGAAILVPAALALSIWLGFSAPAEPSNVGMVTSAILAVSEPNASTIHEGSGEASASAVPYDAPAAPSESAPPRAVQSASRPPVPPGGKPPRLKNRRGLDLFNDTE